jgi:hypothetical protein
MSVRNSCSWNGLWNYSCSFVKTATVVATGSVVSGVFRDTILRTCENSSRALGRYVCLYTDSFFNRRTFINYTVPIFKLKDFIANTVKPILPHIQVGSLSDKVILEELAASKNDPELHKKLSSLLFYFRQMCMQSTSELLAHSFAEEVLFRCVIPKVLHVGLSKLLPERFEKTVSDPASRIITLFLFAFLHADLSSESAVLPHFLMGAWYDFLYQRYGLAASTAAHFTNNLLSAFDVQNSCIKVLVS